MKQFIEPLDKERKEKKRKEKKRKEKFAYVFLQSIISGFYESYSMIWSS